MVEQPAFLRRGDTVQFIDAGGLPIGVCAGAAYRDVTITLDPGDMLLLVSAGDRHRTDQQAPDRRDATRARGM